MKNNQPLNDSVVHTDVEAPPFLGTWKRVYIALVIYLFCLMALFYLFTRVFNQ